MGEQKMTTDRRRMPRSLEDAMRQAMDERGAKPSSDGEMPNQMEAESAAAMGLTPPGSPDDYVITLPRGVERDAQLEAAARRWFHSAGLPQGVAAGIAREYCRHICEPMDAKQAQRAHDLAMAQLRRDWGGDFERKLGLAHSVIDACRGGDALEEALEESGLVDNVWLLRTLAALGEMRSGKNGGAR